MNIGDVTEKFDTAIYGIRDSKVEPLAGMARDISQRIGVQQIFVAANLQQRSSVPLRFGFHEVIEDDREVAHQSLTTLHAYDTLRQRAQLSNERVFAPMFMVDPESFQATEPDELQSFLVPALAAAHQYVHKGYENRLQAVYAQGLKNLTLWLNNGGVIKDVWDPRLVDQEELLHAYLGERFFHDTGFDDWRMAMSQIASPRNPNGRDRLIAQTLLQNRTYFLAARELLVDEQGEYIASKAGEGYFTSWSPNLRAQFLAQFMTTTALLNEGYIPK